MALLTAAEVKASREAVQARVNESNEEDVTQAISEAEAVLFGALGFTISKTDDTTFDPNENAYLLALKAVRKLTVYSLRSSESDGGMPPLPPGAMMTGFASEGVQASYFTPNATDTETGYQDVDALVEQIRRAAGQESGSKGIASIELRGAHRVLDGCEDDEVIWT